MIRFSDADIASTGAFLVGELERLDPKLHEPIADFTWSRDMPAREDVTITDTVTSFMYSNYAGGFGGTGAGKKSWVSNGNTTTPARTSVEMHKVNTPFTLWGEDLAFNIIELQRSMAVNRPIDAQKLDALHKKFQLDVDLMAYVGDDEVGVKGLLNSDQVTSTNVGAWSTSLTVEQILNMVNSMLEKAWKTSAYTRMPNKILLPPAVFAAMAGRQLTNTPVSVLDFVKKQNIVALAGGALELTPCKYLAPDFGFFSDSTTRMVVYTQDSDVVRLPLVDLQSLAPQFRGLEQVVPYYAGIGGVEFVRPEMVYYGVFAA